MMLRVEGESRHRPYVGDPYRVCRRRARGSGAETDDRERCAEGRTLGDTERERRGERVAEHPLHHRPGDRKPDTRYDGRDHPRHPDVPDDERGGLVTRTGQSAEHLGQGKAR